MRDIMDMVRHPLSIADHMERAGYGWEDICKELKIDRRDDQARYRMRCRIIPLILYRDKVMIRGPRLAHKRPDLCNND